MISGDGASRGLSDRLVRWGARRFGSESGAGLLATDREREVLCGSKAFRKFLACLAGRESPVLLDLGQAVGSNITFFGERHGCKIFIEDLYADFERQARSGTLSDLPSFLETRLDQSDGSVDGILGWDVFDYLDRPAAFALARQLTRILRPGGALIAFFRTSEEAAQHYTRYVVVDDMTIRHRPYPGSLDRQPVLLNRDIIKMFEGLLVSDSFLLKTATREILFRKPAHLRSGRTPI